MSMILGITNPSPATTRGGDRAWCSVHLREPALEELLQDAWARGVEGAELQVPPGVYPLEARITWTIRDGEVDTVGFERVESSGDPCIEHVFRDGLVAMGRLAPRPHGLDQGVRSVVTTLVVEVPRPVGQAVVEPELTATFAAVLRGVLASLRGSVGGAKARVVDLRVWAVGERWQVEPMDGDACSVVQGLRSALGRAGLLADEGAVGAGARVSLWVGARPVH